MCVEQAATHRAALRPKLEAVNLFLTRFFLNFFLHTQASTRCDTCGRTSTMSVTQVLDDAEGGGGQGIVLQPLCLSCYQCVLSHFLPTHCLLRGALAKVSLSLARSLARARARSLSLAPSFALALVLSRRDQHPCRSGRCQSQFLDYE